MSALETLRHIVDTQNAGDTFCTVRHEDLKLLLAIVDASDELAELVSGASEHWPKLKSALRKYRNARTEL